MRFPLDNGNGYRCDACNRIVDSWFIIHVQALMLKDSTGCNEHIAKCDLCKQCYEEKFGSLMKPKRKKKEKKKPSQNKPHQSVMIAESEDKDNGKNDF